MKLPTRNSLKERFFKFETIRGIILMPAGVILIYTTWYHIQFSIQFFFTVLGFYWIIDGLRKIFVNRPKQAAKLQKAVQAHLGVST